MLYICYPKSLRSGVGNLNIKRFEKKLWLSSPTMHGDELKYMKEAYDTNWMSTLGKNIDEVARMACEVTGAKYAVPHDLQRDAEPDRL